MQFRRLAVGATLASCGAMTRSALLAVILAACGADGSPSNEPALTGDTCALYTTDTACRADSDCTWFGTGCACPPNDPSCVCSAGACGAAAGSGSSSGSGSTGAGCACPDGGVCYEQIGGPAQPAGGETPIACTQPTPGPGDPCGRIANQGTCSDSATVTGLCLCDNGER